MHSTASGHAGAAQPATLCGGATHLAGVTLFKIVLLLVVAVAAYTQGSASNMTPFANTVWDADGVFMGASLIFFSFTGALLAACVQMTRHWWAGQAGLAALQVPVLRPVLVTRDPQPPRPHPCRSTRATPPADTGFDAIGNAAEEARDVGQLPWAILGTVCTSTTLYLMLALGLALMVCPSIACPAIFFLPVRGTTQCLELYGENPNCPPGGCVCPPIVAPAPGTSVPAPPPQVTNADCFQAVNFISAFMVHGACCDCWAAG